MKKGPIRTVEEYRAAARSQSAAEFAFNSTDDPEDMKRASEAVEMEEARMEQAYHLFEFDAEGNPVRASGNMTREQVMTFLEENAPFLAWKHTAAKLVHICDSFEQGLLYGAQDGNFDRIRELLRESSTNDYKTLNHSPYQFILRNLERLSADDLSRAIPLMMDGWERRRVIAALTAIQPSPRGDCTYKKGDFDPCENCPRMITCLNMCGFLQEGIGTDIKDHG